MTTEQRPREFDLYFSREDDGSIIYDAVSICENSVPWTPECKWAKPTVHVIEHSAYEMLKEVNALHVEEHAAFESKYESLKESLILAKKQRDECCSRKIFTHRKCEEECARLKAELDTMDSALIRADEEIGRLTGQLLPARGALEEIQGGGIGPHGAKDIARKALSEIGDSPSHMGFFDEGVKG